MMQIKQRKRCSLVIFQISLLCTIEGLSLYPASDLTAQSFTLVCDLQGSTWTQSLIFSYANGKTGGGCTFPPNPACGSSVGTITSDTQTVNLTLSQDKILDIGDNVWKCTHGTDPAANFSATVIALCTNGKTSFEDNKISISCSCGYPSVEADVEYKDSKNGNLLQKQTLTLGNSSGSQCSFDNRSMDFFSHIVNYPSETEEVCATIRTVSQISTPVKLCADCSQDIFFYGFLPVFLIVLIASIAINILKIDFLSKQFGEFTWKKVGITAVFCVIAIIIGVCLGLLIKGCDKKFLALGLSFLFGILLVVALIIVLIYYHKKCESKSGVPERVLDYIQCSQLGQ